MVDYLRETIGEIDDAVQGLMARRSGLARRLAVLEAATSSRVAEAVEDYKARVAEQRPYEGAEDARTLLEEAHRRFGS